jgi:hypothetical protein
VTRFVAFQVVYHHIRDLGEATGGSRFEGFESFAARLILCNREMKITRQTVMELVV